MGIFGTYGGITPLNMQKLKQCYIRVCLSVEVGDYECTDGNKLYNMIMFHFRQTFDTVWLAHCLLYFNDAGGMFPYKSFVL